jgi:hypothetical protein
MLCDLYLSLSYLPHLRAAFGVMMWEVATGASAFKRLHYGGFYQAVVVEGLRPQLPPDMPPDYTALMQKVGRQPALSSIVPCTALEPLVVAGYACVAAAWPTCV